jgi:hypothetical protein
MALTRTQYREGDVLLVAAPQPPTALLPIRRLADRTHGLMPAEASKAGTGGSHPPPILRPFRPAGADDPAEWLGVSGGRTALTRIKHAPPTMEPGVRRIHPKRQCEPAKANASRLVVAD